MKVNLHDRNEQGDTCEKYIVWFLFLDKCEEASGEDQSQRW